MIPEQVQPDTEKIAETLRLFVKPGEIGEVRFVAEKKTSKKNNTSGFFFKHDEIDEAAKLAAKYRPKVIGSYVVMNPIDAAIIGERDTLRICWSLTSDKHIARRNWLLIDSDPARTSGVSASSSTDAEKLASRNKMDEVLAYLQGRGWPMPIVADSGNGWHLLFRVDMPNDASTRQLYISFLESLSKRFTVDKVVKIDIGVFNASRITKLYGTVARKGPDEAERPHRLSQIESRPQNEPEPVIATGAMLAGVVEDLAGDGLLRPTTQALLPSPAAPADAGANAVGPVAVATKPIQPDVDKSGFRLGAEISPGTTNNTLTAVAGVARRCGCDEDEIFALINEVHRKRRPGSQTEQEIRDIARSIAKKEPDAYSEMGVLYPEDTATFQRELTLELDRSVKSLKGGRDCFDVAKSITDKIKSLSKVSEQQKLTTLTSAELDAGNFAVEYLIPGVLVKGQPCIIAAPKKCLKTSISIDLTLSLAGGEKFLGEFPVPKAVRVAFISGESGSGTIQDTARRIAQTKLNKTLANYPNAFWCFTLPKLGQPDTVQVLTDYIKDHALDVLIIDPAYLCMSLGDSASNLFVVGDMLSDLNRIAEATGVTFVICHHTRKKGREPKSNPYAKPELDDISWAGFQEWARQWILLNRRSAFEKGRHELWFSVGGSAGHSDDWGITIEEGNQSDPGGRGWKVEVEDLSTIAATIKTSNKATKVQETIENNCKKVLEAYGQVPDGGTATEIRDATKLSGDKIVLVNMLLLKDGLIEHCQVTKANRKYAAYRLKQTPDAAERVDIEGLAPVSAGQLGQQADCPTQSSLSA